MGRHVSVRDGLTDLVFNEVGVADVPRRSKANRPSSRRRRRRASLAAVFEVNEEMKANNRHSVVMRGNAVQHGRSSDGVRRKYDIDFWHMNSATPATRVGAG